MPFYIREAGARPNGVTKVAVSVGFILLVLTSWSFSQPLFDSPVNLGPKINTALHESDPFLSADGKKLFFARDFDLWYAEWTDTGWADPINLGPTFNTGPGIEHSPSVSPDGQKLYFVPDSRSVLFWDIWVSTFDSSIDDWKTPVNLGWPVNTPGTEFSARIGPDGRHLYFSSISDSVDSLNPTGRCGIYVSELVDSSWSIPTKIPTSSCATDDYPSITADGRWFYFDRFVSGIEQRIFVSESTISGWNLPYDLSSQLGGPCWTPYVTPTGESLFFASSRTVGGFGRSDIWISELISLGIADDPPEGLLPRIFELYQNYPNPFNSRTKISFFVSYAKSGSVSLTVYNLLGFPVRHLIEGESIRERHEIEWNGADDAGKEVASGIYFFKLQVGSETTVKKAVFIK